MSQRPAIAAKLLCMGFVFYQRIGFRADTLDSGISDDTIFAINHKLKHTT